MFKRFGPFDLFSVTDSSKSSLDTALNLLHKQSETSKAKGFKALLRCYDNLMVTAQWAFTKRKQISSEFPRNSLGDFYKSRHLIIRHYEDNISPSGQSLSSRGFEGTNYRLVIASDIDRKLKCRYGEYTNLSGIPITFREEYPIQEKCDICHDQNANTPCNICGKWYCYRCSVTCDKCGHITCTSCGKPNGPVMSAHEWYYHRKSG